VTEDINWNLAYRDACQAGSRPGGHAILYRQGGKRITDRAKNEDVKERQSLCVDGAPRADPAIKISRVGEGSSSLTNNVEYAGRPASRERKGPSQSFRAREGGEGCIRLSISPGKCCCVRVSQRGPCLHGRREEGKEVSRKRRASSSTKALMGQVLEQRSPVSELVDRPIDKLSGMGGVPEGGGKEELPCLKGRSRAYQRSARSGFVHGGNDMSYSSLKSLELAFVRSKISYPKMQSMPGIKGRKELTLPTVGWDAVYLLPEEAFVRADRSGHPASTIGRKNIVHFLL